MDEYTIPVTTDSQGRANFTLPAQCFGFKLFPDDKYISYNGRTLCSGEMKVYRKGYNVEEAVYGQFTSYSYVAWDEDYYYVLTYDYE